MYIFPYKSIRKQIWPCCKKKSRPTRSHHLNKLFWAQVPNAAYQVPRSLALWFRRRSFLKGFYYKWALRPSWSHDLDHLNKLSFLHSNEAPCEILLWLAQWFLRRKCLKSVDDGRTMDERRMHAYTISSPRWAFGLGELQIDFSGFWTRVARVAGKDTYLSSPHLCFIIVFICDLFVSRGDPLMS